jgi:7,8-dihydropterin-6-yl-methyl-4-(beta-D-ribofuranosyl)aminobenzene 5'-phosphate synthase
MALHNEWGLALALESRIGNDTRNLLLDYGYTPEALLNNMEIMSVDPSKVQAMILSHGHFDHFGGLIGFLQRYRDNLPSDLTLYVGGEDNFCNRKAVIGAPGHFADWGVLDHRELEALRVRIVKCEQPRVIEGHAFSTGHIERRTFERRASSKMRASALRSHQPSLPARSGRYPAGGFPHRARHADTPPHRLQ